MKKDTFYTWSYRNGTISTCQNRETGKEEIIASLGIFNRKTCNTIAGAKRWISKEMKAHTIRENALITVNTP